MNVKSPFRGIQSLTTEDITEKTGVSQSMAYSLKNGNAALSVESARKIAER